MGVDDCDPNADCINLQGAYLCHCLEGYFGTGYTCKRTYIALRFVVIIFVAIAEFEEEPTTMAAPETTVVTTPEPTIVPPGIYVDPLVMMNYIDILQFQMSQRCV